MKNLFLGLALLISSIVFSQEPVLDSIQVFKPMPEPVLIATIYEYETFFEKLTEVSDRTGANEVICVFFYKEDKDSPQKTLVKTFIRKKQR
jgi:hypothetical protein